MILNKKVYISNKNKQYLLLHLSKIEKTYKKVYMSNKNKHFLM